MFDTSKKKVALLVTAILALLAVFQMLLIFGAPFGRFAWGGQNEVLPTSFRIGSAVSILIYAIIGFVSLSRSQVWHFRNSRAVSIAAWVIAGYFCIGILMNLASRSTSERLVMTPVVTVLAIASLYVARKDSLIK